MRRRDAAAPPDPPARRATLTYLAWVLAWFLALGGLALEAWIERPVPRDLPSIGGTASRARPLCVVILDGVREGVLWEEPSALPWLRAFARGGAGGVARAGDPTLTAACVRTLLSGRRPDLLIALHNFDAPPVEGTWLQSLRALGARAAHGGDAGIAQMAAPWLDPADVLAFRDQGPVDQGACDAAAVPFVLERARRGYEVLTLHLTGPDHAGHKHGAAGEPYRAACARADEQTRTVVEAFLERHPDGTVLVAADHGVSLAGTHGGGEEAARRAPFVLRGPGVALREGLEIEQAALAPSLAALLGLPQPPLADAPLDARLLAVPAVEAQRALDAYLQARLALARRAGRSQDAEPLERRRAEAALSRLGAESEEELRRIATDVEALLQPRPYGLRWLASLLAVLGLLTFVRVAPPSSRAPPTGALALGIGVLVSIAALGLLPAPLDAAAFAGGLALAGTAWAFARGGGWGATWGAGLGAVLLAVPVFAGGGMAIQSAAARATNPAAAIVPAAVGLAAAGLLTLWGRRRGALSGWFARSTRPAPAALAALAGGTLGLLLSARPFIDPWVPLQLLVAAAALAAAFLAVRAAPASPAVRATAWGAFAVLAVLAAVPFLACGSCDPGGWTLTPPWQSGPWAAAGVGVLLAVLTALPRPWTGRGDRAHVAAALVALGLAWAGRSIDLPREAIPFAVRLALGFGPQVAALAALGLALRACGSPEGRLAARVVAGLALARRLTASDAEVTMLALLALACALGARLPFARTRRGLAGLAVVLLLVRTAAFHAAGGVESFSTVDVGRGFLGLEEFVDATVRLAVGQGISWQVYLATTQLALRFALPWVLLLAAAAHAARGAPLLRVLLGDLALGLAARGALLTLGLWSLADNAWWVEKAKDVFNLGGGDLLLLLVASVAAGFWRSGAAPGGPLPVRRAAGAGRPVPREAVA